MTALPRRAVLSLCASIPLAAVPAQAQDAKSCEPMTLDRLDTIIKRIDENAVRQTLARWQFAVEERPVSVITDIRADRMRIISPIRQISGIGPGELFRMMQANFDSALDARYGIAQEILWSTYIHPLGALTTNEFLSGLGQTVNLTTTYGTTYNSGALTFGGGDSNAINRALIDKLLEQGRDI